MNKNTILYTHPVVGNITFNDVINDLKIIIDDLSLFEEVVFNILQNLSCLSDEDISSLYNYSAINRLKNIVYLLQTADEK